LVVKAAPIETPARWVDNDESGEIPRLPLKSGPLTKEDVERIVAGVSFLDRRFRVLEKGDGFLVQLEYDERCVVTGELKLQRARKWYVSPWSTETEVVETCWAAVCRSQMHVAGEHFTYRGRRVYSPHFNVEARVELVDGDRFDAREEP
jgi:hypothetical protein